jgi:cell division protein FtsB
VGALKRLVVPAMVALAGYWAVFGGQYSIFDLRRARRERENEVERLAMARHQIDSLQALTDSLQNDPATLERLARERYGMIKDGETLYLFASPDSASRPEAVRDTLR